MREHEYKNGKGFFLKRLNLQDRWKMMEWINYNRGEWERFHGRYKRKFNCIPPPYTAGDTSFLFNQVFIILGGENGKL